MIYVSNNGRSSNVKYFLMPPSSSVIVSYYEVFEAEMSGTVGFDEYGTSEIQLHIPKSDIFYIFEDRIVGFVYHLCF